MNFYRSSATEETRAEYALSWQPRIIIGGAGGRGSLKKEKEKIRENTYVLLFPSHSLSSHQVLSTHQGRIYSENSMFSCDMGRIEIPCDMIVQFFKLVDLLSSHIRSNNLIIYFKSFKTYGCTEWLYIGNLQ